MPVNEFEGEYSWGYNPSFYMAPESAYGTPDEFKNLVNTAHEHGIAIILDVVFIMVTKHILFHFVGFFTLFYT